MLQTKNAWTCVLQREGKQSLHPSPKASVCSMARVESLFTAIVSASARTTIPHTHAACSAIIIPQYLMTNLKPRTLRGCPSNTLYILYISIYTWFFGWKQN